uniref:THAP domain-containing protein 1-like n=1 Tax=Myxine glutinosa TaxID=7769 RepID=UPI00358DF77C
MYMYIYVHDLVVVSRIFSRGKMPKSCACYGCTNRSNQKKDVSFHRFPLENPQLSKWLTNISRDNFHPTENHRVCSEHFVDKDYLQGIHPRDEKGIHHRLLHQAVPTVFPAHPPHKQKEHKKRAPPKKRPYPDDSVSGPPEKRNPAEVFSDDHGYSASPDIVEQELRQTKHKLQEARKELKGLKQKLRRRDNKVIQQNKKH